jgi:hypothetical protein
MVRASEAEFVFTPRNTMHPTVFTCILSLVGQVTDMVGKYPEPELEFILRVDDVEHTLSLGEERRIAADSKEPRVQISVLEHRKFGYANVDFHYPRHLNYRVVADATGALNWTLKGRKIAVMIYKADSRVEANVYQQRVLSQYDSLFEKGTRRVTPATLESTAGKLSVARVEGTLKLGAERIPYRVEQFTLDTGNEPVTIAFQYGIAYSDSDEIRETRTTILNSIQRAKAHLQPSKPTGE